MNTVRFGFIGPGRIVRRVMKDFNHADGVMLSAIASRDLLRAQTAAKEYGAEFAYGSYEELMASPEVDAVYIATPHSNHAELTIACLNAGKHVLCEKPMAVNAIQACAMVEAAHANRRFLMEAMWTRFFPATRKVCELVRAGEIGDVRYIDAKFAYDSGELPPETRLVNPALAGGALLDIGIYPLMYTTMLLGYSPSSVTGSVVKTTTGVDAQSAFTLAYPNGEVAQLLSSITVTTPHTAYIYGTQGSIIVPEFWHPRSINVNRVNNAPEVIEFDAENEGFKYEFSHAAECINAGLLESPIVPHSETVAVTGIMDTLRALWGIKYPCE